jgi:RNA polymerase sigma-70 factor (ECF subfamily)
LRNVLTDLHRRRSVQVKALERFAAESSIASEIDDAELEQTACACFRELLPTLRPEYAQVLQLSDLDGEPAESVAEQVGISKNNLKVRLHRAGNCVSDSSKPARHARPTAAWIANVTTTPDIT